MLFKELTKFIDNLIKFINGIDEIDHHLTNEELKALHKQLRKAGIEIK